MTIARVIGYLPEDKIRALSLLRTTLVFVRSAQIFRRPFQIVTCTAIFHLSSISRPTGGC